MSKADRIKEVLGWLKVVFAALVAVDICTTGAIVGVNHAAYKRIAELENL